jgi:hypothetical protein
MPITLRNKPVEELIRKIGASTGEGPSAVIARLVRSDAERLQAVQEAAAAEKLAKLRAVIAEFPKFTEQERKAVWDELERINEEMFEDPSAESDQS